MARGNVSMVEGGLSSKALGRKSDHIAISKGASTNSWNFYSTSYSRNHRMENFKLDPVGTRGRTTGYSSNEHGYIPITKELDEHDGATINLDGTYDTVTKSSYQHSDLQHKSGNEPLPSNVPICAQSGFNKGVVATLPIQAHSDSGVYDDQNHSTTRSDFYAPATLVPTSSWTKDGSVGTKLTQKDIGQKTETGFSNNRNVRGQRGMSTPSVSFTKVADNELNELIGQQEIGKRVDAEHTTYTRNFPKPNILTGKEAVPYMTLDKVNGTKPTGFTRSVSKPVFVGKQIEAHNVTRAEQLAPHRVTETKRTAPAEFLNLTKGTQSSMYMASFVNQCEGRRPKKIINNQFQIGQKVQTGSVRNRQPTVDRNLGSSYRTENKEQFYDMNDHYRRGFRPEEKIQLYRNAYSQSSVIHKYREGESFRDEMADRHRAQRESFQARNPAYYEEPHRHKTYSLTT